VYEQAINCPVAGRTGRIWSEYARFLEERGRPRTAQNLYLRALVGGGGEDGGGVGPRVTDPADQASLWDGFLRMMRSLRKNPDLTLDELKAAARREHLGGGGQFAPAVVADFAPDQVGSISDLRVSSPGAEPAKDDAEDGAARPAKRSRWDSKAPVATAAVSAGSIDTTAGILLTASRNMPPEIEMLWLARDGGSIPTRPEPALFAASPPKLGDPSGKDLVGNETALRIMRMLTETTHDGRSLGSAVIELCHACWMMTALKEEEVERAQKSLEKKIVSPYVISPYLATMTCALDFRTLDLISGINIIVDCRQGSVGSRS
jgi:hypothetical protein